MESSSAFDPNDATQDEKPPIFKSWSHLYIFVLISHTIIITLFFLFTRAFS